MSEIDKEFEVRSEHTAQKMGSGDLAVLATPAVIAFAENTCKDLISEELTAAQTSVGIEITLQHLKASKIGSLIKVHAEVSERTRTIISYEFTVYDQNKVIATGSHKRAIVDVVSFMSTI